MIIVGDVTPAQIEQKINALFGGWQRGDVPQLTYSDAPKPGTTTIYLVDKPGAAQSSFRIGAVGVPRSTKDYFALTVMNTILGGSFTSRLNQKLREARGYTSGAGARFEVRRAAGPFSASAEIVSAKSDSALLEFMKELNAIRQTVPADELSRAKRYLQLQLPGNFETTQQIAAALVPVALYGLPLDYYNNYVQSVEAVTQADATDVAAASRAMISQTVRSPSADRGRPEDDRARIEVHQHRTDLDQRYGRPPSSSGSLPNEGHGFGRALFISWWERQRAPGPFGTSASTPRQQPQRRRCALPDRRAEVDP